jgi:hypothetical protein
MDVKELQREIVNWIKLDQDGVQWQDSVNSVIKLCIPYKRRICIHQLSITFSRLILNYRFN